MKNLFLSTTRFCCALFVLIIFSSPSVQAQEGWFQQSSSTSDILNGICFTDVDTGTAAGDAGVIVRTVDGGNTWTPQSSNVWSPLQGVSFCDADTGVATGYNGTIIYTRDGGQNWTVAQDGWMITFRGAQMIDSLKGIVVGVNTIFQPLVSVTTDGWQTWDSYNFYLKQGSSNHEGGLTDVCFVDSMTGYASAYVWNGDGAICRTTDGGVNWDTIYWGTKSFNSIDFPSATTGYAVGHDGAIVKTDDGGARWTVQVSNTTAGLFGVDFITEKRGYAVGRDQTILRTVDGGITWDQQTGVTADHLYSVEFIDFNTAFVAGGNGCILCTRDAGGDSLLADRYALSESAGGTIDFSLNAGMSNAGRKYILLGSASGTSPGYPLPGGMVLPLNWDVLTDIICAYLNTSMFHDFHDTLDSQGKADAQLSTGPLPPGSSGLLLNFVFTVNNPWDYHSNPVFIEVTS